MTTRTHPRCAPGRPVPETEEEQTRGLLDMAFHAFVEVDAGGLITDWNAQAENTFAWPRGEAVGQSLALLIASLRDRDSCQKSLQEVFDSELDSGQSRRIEIAALHRAGHEISIELTLFCTARGEAPRVGAFVRDLSPPKPLEKEIEQRRRFVADQLAEGYHEVDLRGNFTFINNHLRAGIWDASYVGTNYKAVFTPEEAAGLREHYSEVYRTGQPARIEYPRTHNGETRFYEQSVSLLKDADGDPAEFAVVTRDCTERKRNEIEVATAKEVAEAASKAKSEFLANMSHEIRTPLHGVMGMLELAGQTELTAEQGELLNMAEDSAHSLLVVINDILDFSRMEAGRLELDCAEFDLVGTVAETMDAQTLSAHQKGLELTYDIAPDVPASLDGDSARLKQVLMNLLGNAVKFTERGKVALRVERAGTQTLDPGRVQLKFSISDTGIGIPPEKQKLIFEAFSQADSSATRKYGGTGLGLAISSRIVKLMGGDLQVESTINKGSTFYFTANFVMAQEASAGEAQSKVEPLGPHPEESTRPLNILLAEDNVVNQKLAVRLLESFGHQVTVAHNGREALQRLQTQSFDLVLMDVEMPEMNGCAATMAIRAHEEKTQLHIPIIAMTAHDMAGDRERCLAVGMDDFLAKPIDAKKLKNIIRTAVGTRSASSLQTVSVAGMPSIPGSEACS